MKKIRAIGLFSGGLDSILSTRLLIEQNIDVIPVKFDIGFPKTSGKKKPDSSAGSDITIVNMGNDYDIPVKTIDVADEYWNVLLNPRFGYGKGINPCVDCHLFMIRKAGEMMSELGASFVYTGEVAGQRPMSQPMPVLRKIEKESNLNGLLLRPLSAKLLPETVPETQGWVDRNKLLDISGRSRKTQIELAKLWNIKNYEQPAGGCILTDRNFGLKMKDLLNHNGWKKPHTTEVDLLYGGRQFRINKNLKIIVGRHEADNNYLQQFSARYPVMEVTHFSSPLTVLQGDTDAESIKTAAAITAAFSKAPADSYVDLTLIFPDSQPQQLKIIPMDKKELEKYRIL